MFNKVIKILLVVAAFALLIVLNRIAQNSQCPFTKNNPPLAGSTVANNAEAVKPAK